MAATAWVFYNAAKHKIGNGVIDLSSTPVRLALYMNAASTTVETATLTIQSQIGSEVSGGRYVAGGLTLSGVTWGFGATTSVQNLTTPYCIGLSREIPNTPNATAACVGGRK